MANSIWDQVNSSAYDSSNDGTSGVVSGLPGLSTSNTSSLWDQARDAWGKGDYAGIGNYLRQNHSTWADAMNQFGQYGMTDAHRAGIEGMTGYKFPGTTTTTTPGTPKNLTPEQLQAFTSYYDQPYKYDTWNPQLSADGLNFAGQWSNAPGGMDTMDNARELTQWNAFDPNHMNPGDQYNIYNPDGTFSRYGTIQKDRSFQDLLSPLLASLGWMGVLPGVGDLFGTGGDALSKAATDALTAGDIYGAGTDLVTNDLLNTITSGAGDITSGLSGIDLQAALDAASKEALNAGNSYTGDLTAGDVTNQLGGTNSFETLGVKPDLSANFLTDANYQTLAEVINGNTDTGTETADSGNNTTTDSETDGPSDTGDGTGPSNDEIITDRTGDEIINDQTGGPDESGYEEGSLGPSGDGTGPAGDEIITDGTKPINTTSTDIGTKEILTTAGTGATILDKLGDGGKEDDGLGDILDDEDVDEDGDEEDGDDGEDDSGDEGPDEEGYEEGDDEDDDTDTDTDTDDDDDDDDDDGDDGKDGKDGKDWSAALGALMKLWIAHNSDNQWGRAANEMKTWLGDQMASVDNLYKPGSAEYNYLWDQMSRKDTAAGRNSQYGPRSVDLGARVAEIKANNKAKMVPGIANVYASALNQAATADSNTGLAAVLGAMMSGGGGGTGGGSSGGLGGLFDIVKDAFGLNTSNTTTNTNSSTATSTGDANAMKSGDSLATGGSTTTGTTTGTDGLSAVIQGLDKSNAVADAGKPAVIDWSKIDTKKAEDEPMKMEQILNSLPQDLKSIMENQGFSRENIAASTAAEQERARQQDLVTQARMNAPVTWGTDELSQRMNNNPVANLMRTQYDPMKRSGWDTGQGDNIWDSMGGKEAFKQRMVELGLDPDAVDLLTEGGSYVDLGNGLVMDNRGGISDDRWGLGNMARAQLDQRKLRNQRIREANNG